MAIDRTPEEQEEYNRLRKDIIKDIKKEIRKKDYNSSNKNTTSSSLTDIIKSRREAGEGVFSSIGGAAKERLKEKLDIRRALPQGGLLTALFPKLKAYKAQQLNPQSGESGGVGATPVGGDSLATTKPLIDSLSINTKIIAKNSMVLPLIQKDSNLIAKTLRRIIRVMQIRRKVNPFAKKTTAILSKSYSAGEAPGQLEVEREEPKKEKNPIEKLLESIKETFINLKNSITKTLTELPGKIITGIVDGIKGLFKITKFASSFLLSLLKPLLGLIFSPVGFALLLAAGIFFSLYKLSKALNKVAAEKVPNMNVMSPEEASANLENASEKDLIATASKAAGRKEPFTLEEAVAYLEDQVKNGKKYAEEGLKDVEEVKRLEKVLKSNDKSKIEAEGGVDAINSKISALKIKISNLGGEGKFKKILKEKDATIPALLGRKYVEDQASKNVDADDAAAGADIQEMRKQQIPNNVDADDAAAGAGMREMSSTPTNVINLPDNDGPGTSSITPSVMTGSTDIKNSAQGGLNTTSTVPSIAPASSSGDINVALTSGLQNDGARPATPITGSKTVPAASAIPSEKEDHFLEFLDMMNDNLNAQGIASVGPDDQTAQLAYNNNGRLESNINFNHPDIIKALKLKHLGRNSLTAM